VWPAALHGSKQVFDVCAAHPEDMPHTAARQRLGNEVSGIPARHRTSICMNHAMMS
jgi:hypothetical protein